MLPISTGSKLANLSIYQNHVLSLYILWYYYNYYYYVVTGAYRNYFFYKNLILLAINIFLESGRECCQWKLIILLYVYCTIIYTKPLKSVIN